MSPDALPSDPESTTGVPLLAGRYQLMDKLGEGGMGAVFRARDTKLDRSVALKMLPAGSVHDAEAVARFRREAKALARLAHPGIIQAFDSGEDGDQHFLVMEFIAGRSLAKVLADGGPVPATRAADYCHQAALALQHAHQNGLIHRDVKPSNLLLASPAASAPGGTVKLLDLGLARFLQDQVGDASLTREGSGMGTPDYCPPEQFRDAHKADPRSDIYSLGCTLYHLITGRVPFPGSSLSEKVTAHEQKEPTPLEEACRDMPAGLALVTQRMMAKRPADRFQSMAEVVAALAPYVATSSPSFRDIRRTSTWTGAQLATMPALPRRRRVLPWLVTGAAVLSLVAVGLVGFAAGWFRPKPQQVAQHLATSLGDTEKSTSPPGSTSKSGPSAETNKEERAKPADDPNVLTVSQKPEAAKYQTIGAAVAAARAGQTIRVLDNGVYRESVRVTGRSERTGITLEAVGGATMEAAAEKSFLVEIAGVPDVTVRGFHLRAAKAPRSGLLVVRGACPGLRLERLELEAEGSPGTNGVEVVALADSAPDRAPVVIRVCVFRGFQSGVVFAGGPGHCFFRTAVRDCLFTDCLSGVQIIDGAQDVQVVGNRFRDVNMSAVQFQFLSEDTEGILVANNTFFDSATALRLWDRAINGKYIQVRNNLVLGGEAMDMHVIDAINGQESRGPGNGVAVAAKYRFSNNWREGKEWPTGKGWIPPDPKKGDVRESKIDGINRDPKSPDFLRPQPNSKLATAGAGNEDPSLPRYIGALPPEGTDPWDWDRTWRMPKDAQLLTVSKQSSGGGMYRTINDALKDAKPWATIRVLDDAKYTESLLIADPQKFEGLTLEAAGAATIELPKGGRVAVLIKDVPLVAVRGFHLSADPQNIFLVGVLGRSPGVLLDHLDCRSSASLGACGIDCESLSIPEGAAPVVVRHCKVTNVETGIRVAGLESGKSILCRGVLAYENDVSNCSVGVGVLGQVRDLQVLGNRIWNCGRSNIYLTDLKEGAANLLIANNALQNPRDCIEIENPDAGLKGIEVLNNLLLSQSGPDMVFNGKDRASLQGWRFAHNWRQVHADKLSGLDAEHWLRNEGDTFADSVELLSLDAQNPDFLRPGSGSPLVSGSAGENLPPYVGSIPPQGVPPWDWDRTWRMHVKKNDGKK